MNSLEKELTKLRRTSPPAEWKESLLDTALSKNRQPPESKSSRFSRIPIVGLATTWVLIAFFYFTTPADPGGTDLADRYGVSPDRLPILAQRLLTLHHTDPS